MYISVLCVSPQLNVICTCLCLCAVDSDALILILPVICRQVQSSTYKLDTASIQSAAVADVDNMLKVSQLCYVCVV